MAEMIGGDTLSAAVKQLQALATSQEMLDAVLSLQAGTDSTAALCRCLDRIETAIESVRDAQVDTVIALLLARDASESAGGQSK